MPFAKCRLRTSTHQHDHPDGGSFRPREVLVLLVLSSIVVVCLDVVFYSSTLEDAYITFRYSEHFAEGHGLGAWNIGGERVEGYTTFLWMLVMSAAHAIGIDVRTAAKILGILMHLVLCMTLIAFPLLRRDVREPNHDILGTPNEAVLAGVFLSFYLPVSWYATSGMETVVFTALTGLAFASVFLRQSAYLLPLLLILLVLTRPEGILMASAVILFYAAFCRREGHSLRGVYLSAIGTLLALVLLTALRLIVFRDMVPNTYWAKAGGAPLLHAKWGLGYVLEWTRYHWILVLIFAWGVLRIFSSRVGARSHSRPWRFVTLISLVAVFIAYVVWVGGDNPYAFPFWRHFVHLAAPIALLLCFAIVRFRPHARFAHLIVLLGIALIVNVSILRANSPITRQSIEDSLGSFPRLKHTKHDEYLVRLKQVSQGNTTIASSLGGELPYFVDAIHIDVLGLNTRYIARHGTFDPTGPQDSKTDMKWVLEQHPDLIEGYIPGTKVLSANEIEDYIETHWRSKMHKELVSSPEFQREYCFVRNWPYHSMDRALFVRESYLVEHQLQDELDCIAVSDTPLSVYVESSRNG